jgi:type IV secretion system protein VirB4
VIGKTGAGKSVLVEALAAQWMRYPDAQLFYFDHGYSAWLLASACGWTHYAIAAGRVDSLGFQPLRRIDEAAERAWAAEWIEIVFGLQGITLTPPQRRKIDSALRLLAGMERENRTLTDLRVHLQDPELQEALRFYTIEGNLGYLLDAKTDCLDDAPVQVFELKHLLEMGDRVLVPTLLYLFRRVERRLDAGRPTLIPIEELWAPLLRSVFANRIQQWLLTMRKQNAAVLLVAHSVQQLRELPNPQIITESCPTKIFLPNPDAKTRETEQLYAELGLNAREIQVIAESVPKRHYYFRSPRGSHRFELGLGPLALAFMAPPDGVTLDETKSRVEALSDRWGNAWPEAWLRDRGLDEWADRFKRLKGGPDEQGSCAA